MGRQKEVPRWACWMCILPSSFGFLVEMSTLSKRQNTPLAALRSCTSDDMSAFQYGNEMMGMSPCASFASSDEEDTVQRTGDASCCNMPLPCFFLSLAQRPGVHYLADASKSPTAPRYRSMAPVPD